MKYIIRLARRQDIDQILEVEREAWPSGLEANEDKIKSRLDVFPEGVMVASTMNGEVLGVVVAEIIDYDLINPLPKTWYELSDNGYLRNTHNPNGNVVFGVDLSVRPKYQNLGIATKLVQEVAKIVIRHHLNFGMLGGRIPEYHKFSKTMSAEQYVFTKKEDGKYLDPEVNFYSQAGLKIVKVIPNYFKDPDSLDYGVLITWKNPLYTKSRLLNKLLTTIFAPLIRTKK